MEKNIWIIANKRKEMLDAQRSVNATGGMRAICILSFDALQKHMAERLHMPSLILIDYEMSKEDDFRAMSFLKEQAGMEGVPILFMTDSAEEDVRSECYVQGALAVLMKPLTAVSVARIERMAWQFDVALNTEKKLEKQSMDLKSAREIERLNKQLKARNDLLYQVFGRYFSDAVMDKIFEDPSGVSIGGEKKDVTVMMADLRGFTAISQMMDSDSMMDLLNHFFGKMVEVIQKYNGTVIEFLGDGILAVFGALLTEENHTESAVAAAIEMQNSMAEVNAYCQSKGYEFLDMGIGIHRGMAFIGNIGSEKVMRYNVIGRVVNECSRIENYSVGNQVLVSDETIRKLNCGVTTGKAIEIKAKGIDKPIPVHEVIKLEGDFACELHEVEERALFKIETEIMAEMQLIVDKYVDELPFYGQIRAMSYKYALVRYEGEQEIPLYSDLRVMARNYSKNVLFTDLYAKVVAKEGKDLRLRFTHINGDYQYLVEKMEREDERRR